MAGRTGRSGLRCPRTFWISPGPIAQLQLRPCVKSLSDDEPPRRVSPASGASRRLSPRSGASAHKIRPRGADKTTGTVERIFAVGNGWENVRCLLGRIAIDIGNLPARRGRTMGRQANFWSDLSPTRHPLLPATSRFLSASHMPTPTRGELSEIRGCDCEISSNQDHLPVIYPQT